MMPFLNDSLLSTYKRKPLPSSLKTHKRKSTKEVEEKHHSNGLRP